jgi:hypothetical protein
MKEQQMSRRQFLKGLTLATSGAALAACQPKTIIVEKEVTREVEKVVKETVLVEKEVTREVEAPKIVEKEVTKIVEKIVTATPTQEPEIALPFQKDDEANEKAIKEAEAGKSLLLKNPLISFIVKANLGKSMYLAGLAKETSDGPKTYAILDNPDCQYRYLQENDLLGERALEDYAFLNSGIWTSNARFPEIEVKVARASIPPFSFVTSQSFVPTEGGGAIECPKESIFENADQWPGIGGEALATLIIEIFKGIQRGVEKGLE